MGQACCNTHLKDQRKRESLLYRNILVLFTGVLLQFHAIEHMLFQPQIALFSLVGITAQIVYVIYKDFEHVDLVGKLKKLLFSAVLTFMIQQALGVTVLESLLCLALLPVINYMINQYDKLSKSSEAFTMKTVLGRSALNGIKSLLSMSWIPSMDVLVLLSVGLTWGVSCAAIVMPGLQAEVLLHDSLLSLSVFNLVRWVRSGWESPELLHNHTAKVYVKRIMDNQEQIIHIKASRLKKGDIIQLTEGLSEGIMIPVKIAMMAGYEASYRDCAREQYVKKTLYAGESEVQLERQTMVKKGVFRCLEDYQSHRSTNNKAKRLENAENDDLGTRVFLFLMYSSAFVLSVATGLTGGIVMGVEKLCMALMVACPCVYYIICPAIQAKIPAFSASINIIMSAMSLPLVGSNKTVVFDRTGTLWHENPQDPEGDYIISDEAKNMLRELIKQGVDIKILSGHSTGNWERHLAKTKQDLQALGMRNVDDNIIFDSQLHGRDSLKGKYIRHLKRYQHFGLKPSWSQKLWGGLRAIVNPGSIIMIGDDINDKEAMKEAHIAIGIGRIRNTQQHAQDTEVAFNDEIYSFTNFITDPKGLTQLHTLLPVLSRSSVLIRSLTILSALFAIALMSVVAGFINVQITINPAFLCSFTSLYCAGIATVTQSNLLNGIIGIGPGFNFKALARSMNDQCKKKLAQWVKAIKVTCMPMMQGICMLLGIKQPLWKASSIVRTVSHESMTSKAMEKGLPLSRVSSIESEDGQSPFMSALPTHTQLGHDGC